MFAARQRLAAGGGDPKDVELRDRYLRQQNAPKPTGDAAHPVQERTLGRYIHLTKPMAARGEMPRPHVIGPAQLDAARQKLADAMKAQAAEHHKVARHIADLAKGGKLDLAHILRHHGPLGVSPSLHAAINGGLTHNERHGDHFHIHGTDAKSELDHAVRVSARRGGQDRIRFGQSSQQRKSGRQSTMTVAPQVDVLATPCKLVDAINPHLPLFVTVDARNLCVVWKGERSAMRPISR